ncbi:tRNA threonylcarbamoyladenosine biosynthesis protein TsaB [Pedobacter sp. UYP30]|uniref:tRNA (adenosine(37)-N6)-threonylcarbamoyltransferase complex dimerization subunit type 1 TsaB n=1 Tax=Pedobacter sp. UYP30 TaxID=1756400 RepID=UPI003397B682
MANILLIETATQVCSVALSINGVVVSIKEEIGQNLHASNLTLFIQDAMKQAKMVYGDLDAVSISKGPGSYTGLRIGTSTAKGLCFALDIPLIAIETLVMMAKGFIDEHPNYTGLICPMIDARRMEVYTAIFDKDLANLMPTEAKIIDQESFSDLLLANQITFIGDGAAKCSGAIGNENTVFCNDNFNCAANMAGLAEEAFLKKKLEDVAYFEPFYLKDFVVTKSKKNLL